MRWQEVIISIFPRLEYVGPRRSQRGQHVDRARPLLVPHSHALRLCIISDSPCTVQVQEYNSPFQSLLWSPSHAVCRHTTPSVFRARPPVSPAALKHPLAAIRHLKAHHPHSHPSTVLSVRDQWAYRAQRGMPQIRPRQARVGVRAHPPPRRGIGHLRRAVDPLQLSFGKFCAQSLRRHTPLLPTPSMGRHPSSLVPAGLGDRRSSLDCCLHLLHLGRDRSAQDGKGHLDGQDIRGRCRDRAQVRLDMFLPRSIRCRHPINCHLHPNTVSRNPCLLLQ